LWLWLKLGFMSISEANSLSNSQWSRSSIWFQRAIYRLRPAVLSAFLKKLLGFKRGWVTVQGLKFYVDPVSHFGQEVMRTGIYEPVFCQTILGLLKPRDRFLDIGANEGFFSLVAAQKVGSQGRVIAVEPQPDLANFIGLNVKANSFSNVQVFPLAFSEQKGEVELALSYSVNSGASSLFKDKVSGLNRIKVRSERFEDWWYSQGSPQFDLVKIDCEGAEIFIFRTAKNALKNHFSKAICLEYHENIIGTEAVWEIDEQLRSAGYELSELRVGVWVYHLPNFVFPSTVQVSRKIPKLHL